MRRKLRPFLQKPNITEEELRRALNGKVNLVLFIKEVFVNSAEAIGEQGDQVHLKKTVGQKVEGRNENRTGPTDSW